jgi:D-inositol-3-phosphate glycosyltransferase
VLADDQLRLRLEAGALEQARMFSWEATADATLAVYERARAALGEKV